MTTDIVTHDFLIKLSRANQGPLLSLFMPTHNTGHEMRRDRLRLKNLLQRAAGDLMNRDMRRPEAETFLQPLSSLLTQDIFWERCNDGLAAFVQAGRSDILRLPESFDEALQIGDRFFIKPLLPLLGRDNRFFVLALTGESAHLYEANSVNIFEIDLPEIRKIDVDGDDETLQFQTQGSGGGSGLTEETMYQGQGGSDVRAKADIEKFFQQVSTIVEQTLPPSNGPLVLACVGYLAAMYEKANNYPALLKVKVPGSPDRWSLDELRQRAWQLAEPYFKRAERDAMANFLANRASDQASANVAKIALAAHHGRIETLFIQTGDERWGKVSTDDASIEIEPSPTDESVELLDFAARETILNGGNVYTMADLPEIESPVAALMRY